jgi:hypothetical protein
LEVTTLFRYAMRPTTWVSPPTALLLVAVTETYRPIAPLFDTVLSEKVMFW